MQKEKKMLTMVLDLHFYYTTKALYIKKLAREL